MSRDVKVHRCRRLTIAILPPKESLCYKEMALCTTRFRLADARDTVSSISIAMVTWCVSSELVTKRFQDVVDEALKVSITATISQILQPESTRHCLPSSHLRRLRSPPIYQVQTRQVLRLQNSAMLHRTCHHQVPRRIQHWDQVIIRQVSRQWARHRRSVTCLLMYRRRVHLPSQHWDRVTTRQVSRQWARHRRSVTCLLMYRRRVHLPSQRWDRVTTRQVSRLWARHQRPVTCLLMYRRRVHLWSQLNRRCFQLRSALQTERSLLIQQLRRISHR